VNTCPKVIKLLGYFRKPSRMSESQAREAQLVWLSNKQAKEEVPNDVIAEGNHLQEVQSEEMKRHPDVECRNLRQFQVAPGGN